MSSVPAVIPCPSKIADFTMRLRTESMWMRSELKVELEKSLPAVMGRPCGSHPFLLGRFTRSRKISRSNSANTASIPASALPLGVVRSSASQSDTSAFSSWSVFTRSTSDRPQRSSRQTRTPAVGQLRACR